ERPCERSLERRDHFVEVIGLLVPPDAECAARCGGEGVHTSGMRRPRLADDERSIAEGVLMEQPGDRHEVTSAAEQERLAVGGGDAYREQCLVDFFPAVVTPADESLEQLPESDELRALGNERDR